MNARIKRWEGGGQAGYHFRCPGCRHVHGVRTEGGSSWAYNGNSERPTFSPSVLVTYEGSDAGKDGAPPNRCHSFVTDGRIQFLADCSHDLASQTVDLPLWDAPTTAEEDDGYGF